MADESNENGSPHKYEGFEDSLHESRKPLSAPEQYFPLDVISSTTGMFSTDASF